MDVKSLQNASLENPLTVMAMWNTIESNMEHPSNQCPIVFLMRISDNLLILRKKENILQIILFNKNLETIDKVKLLFKLSIY